VSKSVVIYNYRTNLATLLEHTPAASTDHVILARFEQFGQINQSLGNCFNINSNRSSLEQREQTGLCLDLFVLPCTTSSVEDMMHARTDDVILA
jgi:hypothetical protein